MTAVVVFVTAPDAKVSRRIANALVSEGLAACVTEIPGATSTYQWKGKVERAREVVLVIKTRSSRTRALARRVRELHPYEVPEILALPVSSGEARYLRWIEESTRP